MCALPNLSLLIKTPWEVIIHPKKKNPKKPALKRFENVVNCNKLLLSR